MTENFLNNFIKPQYRERLLYELKSSYNINVLERFIMKRELIDELVNY